VKKYLYQRPHVEDLVSVVPNEVVLSAIVQAAAMSGYGR